MAAAESGSLAEAHEAIETLRDLSGAKPVEPGPDHSTRIDARSPAASPSPSFHVGPNAGHAEVATPPVVAGPTAEQFDKARKFFSSNGCFDESEDNDRALMVELATMLAEEVAPAHIELARVRAENAAACTESLRHHDSAVANAYRATALEKQLSGATARAEEWKRKATDGLEQLNDVIKERNAAREAMLRATCSPTERAQFEQLITKQRALAEEQRAAKNGAYSERNQCVALILHMAVALGWRAGVGVHVDKQGETWEADWRTLVSVDLPTGQVSWHFHDSERHLLRGLTKYSTKWDGHDTAEKYRRVSACRPATAAAAAAAEGLREAAQKVLLHTHCGSVGDDPCKHCIALKSLGAALGDPQPPPSPAPICGATTSGKEIPREEHTCGLLKGHAGWHCDGGSAAEWSDESTFESPTPAPNETLLCAASTGWMSFCRMPLPCAAHPSVHPKPHTCVDPDFHEAEIIRGGSLECVPANPAVESGIAETPRIE